MADTNQLLSLTVPEKELAEIQGGFAQMPKRVDRAIAAAINRTLAYGKKLVQQDIAAAAQAEDPLKLTKRALRLKSRSGSGEGALKILDGGIRLDLANAVRADEGVRIQVLRSMGRDVPGAFIAKAGNWPGVVVYRRQNWSLASGRRIPSSKPRHRNKSERPVKRRTDNLLDVIHGDDLRPGIEQQYGVIRYAMNERLTENFVKELDKLAGQAAGESK